MVCLSDSLGNRILDCLNIQETERCKELSMLFERCNLRELQSIFPNFVQTIFGQNTDNKNGWGLRTMTKEHTAPSVFDALFNFFAPMGAMLKLCYRLGQESIKFEVNLKILPPRMLEMLHNGEYSMYYSNLLEVDPYSRTINALTLNPFDYFMLHFIMHGTVPLHTKYSPAQQVNTEGLKSIYFLLVTEYLTTFLPANAAGNLLPDPCLTSKIAQPLPLPIFQHQRSPKYIKTASGNLFSESRSNTSPISNNQTLRHVGFDGDLVRNSTWRTETVLHLFVDIWLRNDIENSRHLPSSEFIRAIRLLVKQIHAFAFAAPLDDTSMVNIRYLAQPMLRVRIFPFLRSAISLWPLDSSMSMVLELWYSYIQPWRYTRSKDLHRQNAVDAPSDQRFDSFVAENLYIYTQIFIQVLPRFQRLDYTLLQNCIMLHRLIKIFCEGIPLQLLQETEKRYMASSIALDASYKCSSFMTKKNCNSTISYDWETSYPCDMYVPMFGELTKMEIQQFTYILNSTRSYINREITRLTERKNSSEQHLSIFASLMPFLKRNTSDFQEVHALHKVSDILESTICALCSVFNVDLLPCCMELPQYDNYDQLTPQKDIKMQRNNNVNNFASLSPKQMNNELQSTLNTYAVDPALLPVQIHECKLFVRFFHQVACKINDMFSTEIQWLWERSDIWGRLAHQVFLSPMVTAHFEKTSGFSELREESLPARVSFRSLGSYRTLAMLTFALVIGQILWSAPSFGVFVFLIITIFYYIIMAILSAD